MIEKRKGFIEERDKDVPIEKKHDMRSCDLIPEHTKINERIYLSRLGRKQRNKIKEKIKKGLIDARLVEF